MNDSWIQVLTLMIGNFGIIWWFRRECREDWKMCNAEIKTMNEEFKQFREIWLEESKDFHKRLLEIEMNKK